MVTIVGPRGLHEGVTELVEDIHRLETLLADLKRIAGGWVPDADDIRHAPLLDPYVVTVRQAQALADGNHGHPVLQGKVIG